MDLGAELILQIAAFLQSESEVPRSAVQWAFLPGPGSGRQTFAEAASLLSQFEKPLVVGVLTHPGYVALWRPAVLHEAEQRHVNHTLTNQQAWCTEKLAHLDVSDTGVVRFEGWGTYVDVPVPMLRRWLGEYALTWGWTIGAPTDSSHQARLLVLHSGHTWSPGVLCGVQGAA